MKKILCCLMVLWSAIVLAVGLNRASAFHEEVMTHTMLEQGLKPEDYQDAFWKLDKRDRSRLPENYRTMSDKYFSAAEIKYGPQDEKLFAGLEQVKMSGSAEFTEKQFAAMVEDIRRTAGKEVHIVVVDLRQENHLFVNGEAVSLRDPKRNFNNLGMNTEEVLLKEATLKKELQHKTIKLGTLHKNKKHGDTIEFAEVPVQSVMTEAELCRKYNVEYLRLACTDHMMLADTYIDEFISYVKRMPENTWLHIHCAAGVGRTGVIMCLYDMLQNPELPVKTIAQRQNLLGANNVLRKSKHKHNWLNPFLREKATEMRLLSRYVKENHANNYNTTWSRFHSMH